MGRYGFGFGRPARRRRGVGAASLVYRKANTAAWYAALGNRLAVGVNLVYCSHSWGEGMNSKVRGARMVDLIQTGLEAALPTTGVSSVGGTTYIPCDYSSPTTVHTYTALLGGFGGGVNTGGFGRRYFNFTAIGHGASYSYTCASADFHWYNIGGGGTIRVNIDGGTTPGVTQFDIDTSLGTANVWSKTSITMPSDGLHTISVTCLVVGAGTVLFGGMMIYRGNATKGIRVIDASRQASTSADNNCGDSQLKLLTGFTAAVIALDVNDYNNQIVTATWKTNIAARAAEIRTQLGASTPIFLVLFNAPNNLGARIPVWSTLEVAAMELADADSFMSVILLSGVYPSAAADPTHINWDNVTDVDLHPNSTGAALLASLQVARLAA